MTGLIINPYMVQPAGGGGSFPDIRAQINTASDSGVDAGGTGTVAPAVPSGHAAGNRLVLCVSNCQTSSDIGSGNTTSTPACATPTGFSLIRATGAGNDAVGSLQWFTVFEKKNCTGSEGAPSCVANGSGAITAILFCVTGDDVSQTMESAGTNGSSDPPNLTPSWGSAKTLWIGAVGAKSGGVWSGFPTNCADDRTSVNTLGGILNNDSATGIASASSEVSSFNPDAFSGNVNLSGAQTLAIKPA